MVIREIRRSRFYLFIFAFCLLYWLLDSAWSFLSFERNLQVLIFKEPTSYFDTLILRVSPYQVVSRLMVVALFLTGGFLLFEFIKKKQTAEKALVESEEKYRRLITNANDAIFILQDGAIKFPNPRTMDLFGYSEKEFGDLPFDGLIHEDDRQRFVEELDRRLGGEDDPPTSAFRIVTRKDEILWVQINTAWIRWNNRPATLNIVRDVTREKKMETKLRQTQKMEAVGRLAGGIAHDFNNILGIILGNCELALQDVSERSGVHSNLTEIRTACLRARDVVKQLLNFSRKSEQARKPVYIQPIVKEAVQLLRASIPATIEIQTDIPSHLTAIKADSTQIHQVLINLCTNAAHAMEPQGGTLSISIMETAMEEDSLPLHTLRPGRYVQITVSDTGHGIPPDIIERIFDPYFTTKEVGKGSGFGLALVHSIVESHEGAISVYSEPGKGATFKVFFPVVGEVPVSEGPVAGELRGGNESVLIVDDEEAVVSMVGQVLERHGYVIRATVDPLEALELFRLAPERFDLLITDMTMPHLTGVDLSKKVLEIRPEMPIIICTGFSEQMSLSLADEIGIRRYIEKPFNSNELIKAIRDVLDEKQAAG